VDTTTLYIMRAIVQRIGSSRRHAVGRKFEEKIDRSAVLTELDTFGNSSRSRESFWKI
jgi:hypothetical protein